MGKDNLGGIAIGLFADAADKDTKAEDSIWRTLLEKRLLMGKDPDPVIERLMEKYHIGSIAELDAGLVAGDYRNAEGFGATARKNLSRHIVLLRREGQDAFAASAAWKVLAEQLYVTFSDRTDPDLQENIIRVASENIHLLTGETTETVSRNRGFALALCRDPYFHARLRKKLTDHLATRPDGAKLSELQSLIPCILMDSETIEAISAQFPRTKLLPPVRPVGGPKGPDEIYALVAPDLKELIKAPKPKRTQLILTEILGGATQGAAAKKAGATVSASRKIISRGILSRIPDDMAEFRYRGLFEGYDLSAAEFAAATGEDTSVYYFLKNILLWKSGDGDPRSIADDKSIPGDIRQKAAENLGRQFVLIGGRKVPIDRAQILDAFIKETAKTAIPVDDLLYRYKNFMRANHLPKERFDISRKTLSTVLRGREEILRRSGMSVRWYDNTDTDPKKLLEDLGIKDLKDSEISCLLLCEKHPEVMEKYGLEDEYELHSFLTRHEEEIKELGIKIKRSPLITIGTPDMDRQLIQILQEANGDVSRDDLIRALRHRYGIREEAFNQDGISVLARKYLTSRGTYNIHVKKLPDDKLAGLMDLMENEIYLLSEVKRLYSSIYPLDDTTPLESNINLSKIGYHAINQNVVRKDFDTAKAALEAYFRRVGTVRLEFHKDWLKQRAFTVVMEDLQKSHEFIRCRRYTFIRAGSLFTQGISIRDMTEFAEAAVKKAAGRIFTLRSLKQDGFSHPLEQKALNVGYDEFFLNSVLRFYGDTSYLQLREVSLFREGKKRLYAHEVVADALDGEASAPIKEVRQRLAKRHGLSLTKEDVWRYVHLSGTVFSRKHDRIFASEEELKKYESAL